jgi:hypothetical protein
MSAFLVSMLTINRIVATISFLLRSESYSHVTEAFAAAGIDTAQTGWEERLAKAMFALNQDALNQRYGDPAEERFIYRHVPEWSNLYQALKSIDCWLYQCAEGNVPKRKLYQLFKTAVRVWLLELIVYRSTEYDQALWD